VRRARCWSILLGCLLTLPATSAAQTVEFDARSGEPAERRLADFLERGTYSVLARDTILSAGQAEIGSLLVLDASTRVSATVAGSVYVVDGDLFLRPGARVEGDVVVLGGGYYASELAEVTGDVVYRPNDRYTVVAGEGGWTISRFEEEQKAVELPGLYGFGIPYYQRVDAVTLRWGALLRATGWAWRPTLEGEIRYLTEDGDFQGTLKQYWYPSRSVSFGFEGERVTRTNEDWIRGNVSNSASFFFVGDDFRNYYGADRVAVVVRGNETATWWPSLSIQWEEATSKEAREQFVLFGDDDSPPNPAIDEGEAVSLIAEFDVRRHSSASLLEGNLTVEAADSSVAGDFSFVFGEASLYWLTPGFASHEVELFGIARGDISGRLPRQRWSAFGGRATLPTFDLLSFYGPRLVYGQASYLIPITALKVMLIGPPKVLLRAATGSTWEPEGSSHFETNLIAGVRWSVLEAGVAFDPGGSDPSSRFYAILRFPGDL
jgi:hypothetical protein